jgi:hypothetical protein
MVAQVGALQASFSSDTQALDAPLTFEDEPTLASEVWSARVGMYRRGKRLGERVSLDMAG